jgi:GxxExxY protein
MNDACESRRFEGHGFLCVLGVFARDSFLRLPGVTENEVAKQIVDVAYRIHTTLGPGLLESVYEAVLAYELEVRGRRVVRQQPIPIVYQGTRIEVGFKADLVVEDKVIVEIKSVEGVAPVHEKQLLTHVRLADKRLGLLINFNVVLIKDGITRIANGMPY